MSAVAWKHIVYSANCPKCEWVHMVHNGTGWVSYFEKADAEAAAAAHKCDPVDIEARALKHRLFDEGRPVDEIIDRVDALRASKGPDSDTDSMHRNEHQQKGV